MSDNNFNILESVIHITEERDRRSIEKVLLQTLSEFIKFDALILLRIPHLDSHDCVDMIISMPKSCYMDKLDVLSYEGG